MSAPLRSSGRMSRADAQHTLDRIQAAAREFISSPSDNSPQALTARSVLHAAESERDHLDASPTNTPNASAIRSWRSRVTALHSERLANSLETPDRVTLAACVTLYGIQQDNDATIRHAASKAAAQLQVPTDSLRLQDSSHVRTATLTGTRYIFTTQAP